MTSREKAGTQGSRDRTREVNCSHQSSESEEASLGGWGNEQALRERVTDEAKLTDTPLMISSNPETPNSI